MPVRRIVGALAVAAAAAALVGTAGAGTPTKKVSIHVSTLNSARTYLRSHGFNLHTFVIQRGRHNYAGTTCSGRRSGCTRSTHVIQIAWNGGSNNFECSPSTGPIPEQETEGPDCVIVQVSDGGTNTARCIEHNSDAVLAQSCDITQTNTTGDNIAVVDQKLDQSGATTVGSQSARIGQTNASGDNDASTGQSIDQRAQKGDGSAQSQTSSQFSDVEQDNASGDNSSTRTQDVSQLAHSKGGSQSQSDDIRGTVNQSTDGGTSRTTNMQHEHQNEVGGADQQQFGPLLCCSFQTGGKGVSFTIDQNANQHATSAAAIQSDLLTAQCVTDALCHVTQHANENGATAHNEQTAPAVFLQIFCSSGNGEAAAKTRSSGFCIATSGEPG